MTYATGFVILEQMAHYFVSPVFYCPKNPWINFPQISQTGKMPTLAFNTLKFPFLGEPIIGNLSF